MPHNFQNYFRQLNFLVLAMAIGLISFAMVSVYVNEGKATGQPEDNFMFYAIAIVLLVAAVFVGQALYKKVTANPKNTSLDKKLAAYKGATIIRLALMEGVALFGITIYLITNDLGFLLLSAVCIFTFRFLKPTKERFFSDIKFSREELDILKDPSSKL